VESKPVHGGDKSVTPGAANVRGIGGASPALSLAALLLLCGACATPPPRPAPPVPPPASAWNLGSATFTSLETDCAGPDGCPSVRLSYPTVQDAPGGHDAAAAIDRFIRADLMADAFGGPPGTPQELSDGLTASLRELLAEDPDLPRQWYVNQKIDVLWQTPRVLSLHTWTETYMGGERSYEVLRLTSFDARTGARLRLEDLVDLSGEGRARFLQAIEAKLRADRGLPAGQTLAEAGFGLQDGALPLPEEFAVAPEGLLLHWGLFVLGSEELGTVTVTLPRETLGDLIPPGSALAQEDPHH